MPRHLLDDGDRPCRGERVLTPQQRAQILTRDESHVDEQHTVDLSPVVDRDDVGFAEPCGRVGFAPEPLLIDGVVGEAGIEQFERYLAVLGGVVGPVDLTHPAPTQQLVQAIRPELGVDATR